MKRTLIISSILLVITLMAAGATLASPSNSPTFPDTIALPNGFFPEGIVVGHGTNYYVGSLASGAIYHGDLRSGEMLGISDGFGGAQMAVGLAFDQRTNFVYAASGSGPTGKVAIYDGASLDLLHNVTLSEQAGFVNDVIITEDAAFLTDSAVPVLYRLGLDPDSGLPDPGDVSVLPLVGFVSVPGFNANGIEATGDDRWLIVVNSAAGVLYRVDPASGLSTPIDLGGSNVLSGDGLVLSGNTLYVVQNAFKKVSVFKLGADFTSGVLQRVIELPDSETPTTADLFGSRLYLVDARFSTPYDPGLAYEVTGVTK